MLKTKLLVLPLVFTSGLAGLVLLPSVRHNPNLLFTFLGAALLLMLWNALVFVWAVRTKRALAVEIALKKQHYLQACGQGVILVYWGWYWPQVHESFHLIVAQLLFAYAFD